MNTNPLNQTLNRIADRTLVISRKLRRHPIATSMVSLSVVCIAAITIAGFSQNTPTIPATRDAPAFPVPHTLTDTTGRKLDATILEKSTTGIKCRRTSDGAEFTIALTKLSAADRKFIAELGQPKAPSAPASDVKAQPDKPAGKATPAKPAPDAKMPFLYFLQSGSTTRLVKFIRRTDTGYIYVYTERLLPDKLREEFAVDFDKLSETDRKFLAEGPPAVKPDFVWGTPPKPPFYCPLDINIGSDDKTSTYATILSRVSNGYRIEFVASPLPKGKKPYGEYTVAFDELSPQDRKMLAQLDYSTPNHVPSLYTLDGKEGTITTKGPLSIKFLRKSDGKELSIPLTKLSAKNRKVIESIKNLYNGEESLPLRIEAVLKNGKKLDITILKRTGEDFSAFICKKTSDGKKITLGFHEFSEETQKGLALIHTKEPTKFPAVARLIVKPEENSPDFFTVLENTGTDIKVLDANSKPITIPIADLDEDGRKFVTAPTRTIYGVPRRFKEEFNMPSSPIIVPAGTAVWVTSRDEVATFLAEDFRGSYTPSKERKIDYEIVITDKDKNEEYRIPPGETISIIAETATTMTICNPYDAIVTKPAPGSKTTNASPGYPKVPNLADPPL